MNKIFLTLIFFIYAFSLRAQKNDTPYDFPIKPGSAKWQYFKSVEDMYKVCQIPPDTLRNLSTKALIQTCLNYPASAVLLIYNTPQQGFEEWRQKFNGIEELYKRENVVKELLSLYNAIDLNDYNNLVSDNEKGKYAFRLKIIEIIIVQDDVIHKLTADQQKQLFKSSLGNYQKIEANESFGFANLESTGRIISKISAISGDQTLKAKANTNVVQEYIKTGLLSDRQILQEIITEAKKINVNE